MCGRIGSPWQAPCLGAEVVEGQRILPPCVIPECAGMLELSRAHLSRSRMLPQSHPPAVRVTLALPEPEPKLEPVRSISIETSGSVFRVPGLGQAPMAVNKRRQIVSLRVIVKIMRLLSALRSGLL